MSTIATLYVANVKEFIRDRAALFWTFAFPLIFIVLFGLIYGNSGSASFNVVLIDQDHYHCQPAPDRGIPARVLF